MIKFVKTGGAKSLPSSDHGHFQPCRVETGEYLRCCGVGRRSEEGDEAAHKANIFVLRIGPQAAHGMRSRGSAPGGVWGTAPTLLASSVDGSGRPTSPTRNPAGSCMGDFPTPDGIRKPSPTTSFAVVSGRPGSRRLCAKIGRSRPLDRRRKADIHKQVDREALAGVRRPRSPLPSSLVAVVR